MFRKTAKSEPTNAAGTGSVESSEPHGKGRPTPSRKEAQAAAKERARAGLDKKSAQKLSRDQRLAQSQKMREAMRTGDDRYLPARDKGKVRRFIRDWVDSRLTVLEMMLPILVAVMALTLTKSQKLIEIGNLIWSVTWLLVIIDVTWMFFRLGRELRQRFPGEDTRGWRMYAVLRALQMRIMRMPKPQVKLFGALPEHYR